jgi:8-oxo-dGTP pyrophosphatase MutT (NUDIX family)
MVVVTAGGIVLRKNNDKTEMLLVYTNYYNSWIIPKGHIEPGETLEQTARRETGEETGLVNFDLVAELGVISRKSRELTGDVVNKDIHVFLYKTDSNETPKPSVSWHEKTGWFGVDEGIGMLYIKEDREFLLKHRGELNFK